MNAAHTPLADLTAANITNEIHGCARHWEAKSVGAMVRMFASGGYDVVTIKNDGKTPYRVVRDQNGREVATILHHPTVPHYAFATTGPLT